MPRGESRTRRRAGEARASGLDAGTFTHRRLKKVDGRRPLKTNSDEISQKLIIAATGSREERLGEAAELRLTDLAVRKVTETPAVCGRGKKTFIFIQNI